MDWLKRLFNGGSCPDCGWLVACESCSNKYDQLDEKLKKENYQRQQASISAELKERSRARFAAVRNSL